ncbi:hypothetical protein P0F15_003340 [Vibrio metschnikovii]|nr:hypothetical protein [Vibrio metschnikovii]EKO3615538.1 hypothetical protein [Vibrio metschnikovii]EKO3619160.1 hypothetical protein [Vibrio metschnikovii]EKO3633008.1 hypothetical protein [Vibrio metschnikovii]EKO3636427.1 hypothetical protein [Vibrio metschnikovii]
MALIECPECDKTISNYATSCVGCGFPLEKSKSKEVAGEVTTQDKYPFFVLAKSDVFVAVNLLNDSAGEEIRQLQADGFEVIADDCMAVNTAEAIELYKWGFTWWNTWGWLSIIKTLISFVFFAYNHEYAVSIILLLSFVGLYFVLKMNKYAFLVMTVLSLNPILWFINGTYLNNRWNHPLVNKN